MKADESYRLLLHMVACVDDELYKASAEAESVAGAAELREVHQRVARLRANLGLVELDPRAPTPYVIDEELRTLAVRCEQTLAEAGTGRRALVLTAEAVESSLTSMLQSRGTESWGKWPPGT